MKHIIILLSIVGIILTLQTAYAANVIDDDVQVQTGDSFYFSDFGSSIAATNSIGNGPGAYLNERGFNAIVFRTGGTNAFGTGDEIARITSTGLGIGTTPTQKLDVNGNIRLTGNIVSPNDICIGTCP